MSFILQMGDGAVIGSGVILQSINIWHTKFSTGDGTGHLGSIRKNHEATATKNGHAVPGCGSAAFLAWEGHG